VRPLGAAPANDDLTTVELQIGRSPRGRWRVAERCAHGHPSVIATAPALPDGTPFPTLFWLTCPWLCDAAARRESAGASGRWAARAAADLDLAESLRRADASYRAARAAEAGGEDPCPGAGTAGQRDPLGVKCVHARVAGALAGIEDPVGLAMLAATGRSCPDGSCASPGAGRVRAPSIASRW
jgi:hypothetical protein